MRESALIFEATLANFEQKVIERSGEVLILVDFWAEWCGPCKMLEPALEQVLVHYAGRVELAKVDTDEEQKLAGRYAVRGFPTVILFVNGEPVDQFTGVQRAHFIQDKVDRYLDRIIAGKDNL
ncbi:MAG: thioredoxin [bacterium]